MRAVVCALAGLLSLGASALAAEYPSERVTIVVPFPPGGSADVVPRILGEKLQKSWGQPVIIENRPGAAGTLGAAAVANASPDGHTLLMSPAGPLAINKFIQASFPFDPLALTPISVAASAPTVLAVRSSMPATDLDSLTRYSRSQLRALSYASAGPGSTQQLSGVLFQSLTDLDLLHVPYRGSNPALADLTAGHVDMMFDNLGSALPLHRQGKIRIIANGSHERSKAIPEVRTLREMGLSAYESSTWFAMMAPPGTSKAIADKVARDVQAALREPDVIGRVEALGLTPVGSTPEATRATIIETTEKWGAVIKSANITE